MAMLLYRKKMVRLRKWWELPYVYLTDLLFCGVDVDIVEGALKRL
jgi:hypothetical protein